MSSSGHPPPPRSRPASPPCGAGHGGRRPRGQPSRRQFSRSRPARRGSGVERGNVPELEDRTAGRQHGRRWRLSTDEAEGEDVAATAIALPSVLSVRVPGAHGARRERCGVGAVAGRSPKRGTQDRLGSVIGVDVNFRTEGLDGDRKNQAEGQPGDGRQHAVPARRRPAPAAVGARAVGDADSRVLRGSGGALRGGGLRYGAGRHCVGRVDEMPVHPADRQGGSSISPARRGSPHRDRRRTLHLSNPAALPGRAPPSTLGPRSRMQSQPNPR